MFSGLSLLLWLALVVASWFMVLATDRHDEHDLLFVPYVFFGCSVVLLVPWFTYEYNVEFIEKRRIRTIDWLYPYSFLVGTLYMAVLWMVLFIHEPSYREAFVRPTWVLFSNVSLFFVLLLSLLPFYVGSAIRLANRETAGPGAGGRVSK